MPAAWRDFFLAEARRAPDPAQDGTATWSLSTLRRAEDGFTLLIVTGLLGTWVPRGRSQVSPAPGRVPGRYQMTL